jgi:hypothetical protein
VYVFDSGTANNELWFDGVLRLTFSMSIFNQNSNVCIDILIQHNILTAQRMKWVFNTKLPGAQIATLYNNGNGTAL